MQVPQWEIFEESFASASRLRNPFLDVRLSVCFTTRGREEWIDGFYDGRERGRHVWRVRFAPMRQGAWTYRTFSNLQELSGRSGSFECTSPVSRGGLVSSSQFPNWFFRQDGRAQFIVNDGWSPHGGPEFLRYPSEQESMVFLDLLSKHGVNMTIDLRQLYGRQDHITDESYLWPWQTIDAATNRIDRDRFNLAYFQRLDRQIAAARARDVFYGVELLYDNSTFRRREWSHHPWNERNGGWLRDWDTDAFTPGWGIRDLFDLGNKVHVEYVSRYLAYTIARTSAFSNVFYALGCESSNIFPGIAITIRANTTADWYGYWGEYLARKDPHGRLLTLGDVGEHAPHEWHILSCQTADLFRHHRNNIVVTQDHTPMGDPERFVEQINRFGERFWAFRRPMVLGEQDLNNRGDYAMERRGFWVALASGFAMGRVDRHFGLADGKRLFESRLARLRDVPPIYHHMKRMAEFVGTSGVRFWRMAPRDDLLVDKPSSIFCLAEPGVEYLIYYAFGGTASVGLPEGAFRATWYNPRTGVSLKPRRVDGGVKRFRAPDGEDWVLHLRSTSGG